MNRIFQRVVENVGVHADQMAHERPLATAAVECHTYIGRIKRLLAATLRWFTAGGAIRIAV